MTPPTKAQREVLLILEARGPLPIRALVDAAPAVARTRLSYDSAREVLKRLVRKGWAEKVDIVSPSMYGLTEAGQKALEAGDG